ncbi:uncharacterized protein F5Z01DRAFT_735898 [Emericellopsis atlantica]|uniref:Uncharacterized protein n=1 Tax=Emericellopsis atlantica TaxID=2614577 RepID=A0A9P7ZPG9_9HYPO|nr:uncharacterized protein F5Z01DRAFT_735898 [Emericellopsis atlantica]KAG9255335.1 hypothetical protein F5Z01DRAFT_735898 [Emericellopsis atlantica]
MVTNTGDQDNAAASVCEAPEISPEAPCNDRADKSDAARSVSPNSVEEESHPPCIEAHKGIPSTSCQYECEEANTSGELEGIDTEDMVWSTGPNEKSPTLGDVDMDCNRPQEPLTPPPSAPLRELEVANSEIHPTEIDTGLMDEGQPIVEDMVMSFDFTPRSERMSTMQSTYEQLMTLPGTSDTNTPAQIELDSSSEDEDPHDNTTATMAALGQQRLEQTAAKAALAATQDANGDTMPEVDGQATINAMESPEDEEQEAITTTKTKRDRRKKREKGRQKRQTRVPRSGPIILEEAPTIDIATKPLKELPGRDEFEAGRTQLDSKHYVWAEQHYTDSRSSPVENRGVQFYDPLDNRKDSEVSLGPYDMLSRRRRPVEEELPKTQRPKKAKKSKSKRKRDDPEDDEEFGPEAKKRNETIDEKLAKKREGITKSAREIRELEKQKRQNEQNERSRLKSLAAQKMWPRSIQRLPTEIRRRILRELLVAEQAIEVHSNWVRLYSSRATRSRSGPLTILHTGILRTCKAMYWEGISVLYGDNEFLYKIRDAQVTAPADIDITCVAQDNSAPNGDEESDISLDEDDSDAEYQDEEVQRAAVSRPQRRRRRDEPKTIFFDKMFPLFRRILIEAEKNRHGVDTKVRMTEAIKAFTNPPQPIRRGKGDVPISPLEEDRKRVANIHTLRIRVFPSLQREPSTVTGQPGSIVGYTFSSFFNEDCSVFKAAKRLLPQRLILDVMSKYLNEAKKNKRMTIDMRAQRITRMVKDSGVDIWAKDMTMQRSRRQASNKTRSHLQQVESGFVAHCASFGASVEDEDEDEYSSDFEEE